MIPHMTLLGSLRSPYCRKVMILAHELGLTPPLELVAATVGSGLINATVQRWNPLAKVPVLITADGQSVYDLPLPGATVRQAASGSVRYGFDAARDAIACRGQGLTDVLLQWSRERARPEPKRTDGYAAVLEAKVFSAIDALDQMPVSLDAAPFGLGHAAITSALGYLDFRFQEWIGAQAILVCATGSLDIWRDLHAPARSPPEITPLSSTEQTGMQTRHCAD
jgi:glutathione S-transferase